MIELSENRIAQLEEFKSLDGDRITYEAVRDLSAVARVSEEWDALLSRSPVNQAFSSSKWFVAMCRNDASISPYVILARRGPVLAGVLPLALSDGGREAAFPNYLCDYSDIVAPRDDERVIEGLLNHALRNSNGYEKIILSHIRLDSNCLRAVQAIEPGREIDELYSQSNVCYYIDLPASYAGYLRAKTSHFRKRLKRLQSIAHRNNLFVRELVAENISPDGLPEIFLSLHLDRHGERSCFRSARGRAFIEEVLPALFRERRIRALALLEGERVIGIDLYTMGPDSLCAWNGGFLSEAEACSPGKLLIDAGIKLAYDLKLGEYDFLRGPEAYKLNLVTGSRAIGRVELSVRHE
ncbi:MAG TPA: GNAT family N-acetyltransferase [Blastocatellia bacterium]|jgi:CelD/BcsL family acetyltransferase involved in cellulose biosynthesis